MPRPPQVTLKPRSLADPGFRVQVLGFRAWGLGYAGLGEGSVFRLLPLIRKLMAVAMIRLAEMIQRFKEAAATATAMAFSIVKLLHQCLPYQRNAKSVLTTKTKSAD